MMVAKLAGNTRPGPTALERGNKVPEDLASLHALGGADVRQAADEQRRTDQEVRDVVQRVDHEDAEQQATIGGDEVDAAGDGEAEQADEDLDGAEDDGDEAVG